MTQPLIKLLSLIAFSLLTIACEDNSTNVSDSCDSCSTARVFSIDESKEHFEVSVYGQTMGTPDLETIEAFLLSEDASSYIDEINLVATGIEGGATYCVRISNSLTRTLALNQLKLIPTDLEETLYKIESVNSCE